VDGTWVSCAGGRVGPSEGKINSQLAARQLVGQVKVDKRHDRRWTLISGDIGVLDGGHDIGRVPYVIERFLITQQVPFRLSQNNAGQYDQED
jgi:hypothetical protein